MVVFTAVITFLLGTAISVPQILGGLLVIGGVMLTSARPAGRSPGIKPRNDRALKWMGER